MANLAQHKKAVHEGVRQCDQQFSWKSSVANHQRKGHEGLKRTTKNNDIQE